MRTAATSLTFPALLKSAVTTLRLDDPGPGFSGLAPGAQALCVAAVAHAASDRLVVWIVPGDADVERATSDVRLFFASLEGESASDAERLVLPFPSQEIDPYRGMTPHLHVASARARALHAAATGEARILVASATALLPRVPAPQRLMAAAVDLTPGLDIAPADLVSLLIDAGFTREDPVDEHGEFCLRGGILDVFPAGASDPYRIEFIGDTIESIRRFDPSHQRSVAPVERVRITPQREHLDDSAIPASSAFDHLGLRQPPRLLVSEPDEIERLAREFLDQMTASYTELTAGRRTVRTTAQAVPPSQLFLEWDTVAAHLAPASRLEGLAVEAGGTRHVACQPVMEFRGRLHDWLADVRRAREREPESPVVFLADTPGRAERVIELARDYGAPAVPFDHEEAQLATLVVGVGRLSRGFRLPDAGLHIFAEADVFEEERQSTERRRSAARAFLSDLRDLKTGDLVVHVDHGIGMFVGLRQISPGGGAEAQEFMELRYAGDDKLYVPVERLDLVQKYTGGSRPPLERLGGTSWERAKTRVRKAMRDMAEELLKLYAARRTVAGHAFSRDTHWQEEFEDAFPYELTPDQSAAIAEIKRDMESPTPMDRLLCGDVGYGKTEVAMRAAFKAAMDGKQVAFLAPTTVLAFQHVKTLRERFAAFPMRIEMVSRFRTRAEQKQVLEDLAAGRVDIIVGTHRLLSKDVAFRDLGLLVVDEEQRFGVSHKEKIKQLRKRVDVLTMTATPIPRTLNMSLVGIRDMSIIETPPKDRLSIQTNVVKFDAQVIGRAIRHELDRGGQVYVVHNRVESIYSIANLVTKLVPEARVVVGHGQMTEDKLERAMLDFVGRKYDVLVATTIVENGLDIPNANTLIVNRADRYGLAQLYQLRGRVGRSDRPAYAYLLIPPEDNLSPVAKKRLAAIREFSDLGSGFRVAALDLEIRGAGNLLGGEQSGHIDAVGFELYMKLLEQAVRELKGEEVEDDVRAVVNLRVDLKIEDTYIADMNQRLMVYRQIASARTHDELDRVLEELRDRYGPAPASVLNLSEYGRIRIMADRLGIEAIEREGATVVVRFRPNTRVQPERLVNLVQRRGDITLIPPNGVRLDLQTASRRGPAGAAGRSTRAVPAPGKTALRTGSSVSWWTARATSAQVAPGFTRAEMLRPPAEDPRGENGVFTRVGGLLSELLG
jgi:transcription-repair coupling factor (superfamily II helicase)